MAIYHANIKSFSRGKGESSLAAAAYRAGVDLVDTKTREVHRYSQRSGVEHYQMLAPSDAPDWCLDPHKFWLANEAWETRANARVARELEVALPSELGQEQRKELALALGQMLVDRYQAVVLVALHAPSEKGDQRNYHTHILMSARQVDKDGLGQRAGGEFDASKGRGANEIRLIRAMVAAIINAHLSQAGVDASVDHRSLRDQARDAESKGDFEKAAELSRAPTRHIGKVQTAINRRAEQASPEQQDRQRASVALDASMQRARDRCALVAESLGHSHESALAERDRERVGRAVSSEISALRRHSGGERYSAAGLALSSFAGVARRQGKGEEVLYTEAKLVDAWLKSQNEAAQSVLNSLRDLPGWKSEPEFTEAQTTLAVPRVYIHGTKPLFFETMEDLTRSIEVYGETVRRPHERQVLLAKAQEQLSVVLSEDCEPRSARVRAARHTLWKAQATVSDRSLRANERRVIEARSKMVEMTEEVCTRFYITRIDPVMPEPDMWGMASQIDQSRKSDSNQHKFRRSRL